MPAEPRTRPLFLAIGGGVILLLLIYLVVGPARNKDSAPASVSAPPATAPVPAAPPGPLAAPAVAPPAASPQGLVLRGVAGSGAIIGYPDGSQRLVAIGREALPGLTLIAVRPNEAVLRGGGAEYRLGFTGAEAAPAAVDAPAATPEAAWRRDTQRYLLGMAPRQVNGRISGYTLRGGASFPALAAAGLRPGDLLLTVNGSELDQERLMDLAATLANSSRTIIEYERGGRRMRAVVTRP